MPLSSRGIILMVANLSITKPTILLQLSGGLDSLGCLFLLLTAPEYSKYDILVHHTKLINKENRAVAESLAIDAILAWFKANPEYREFTYAESTFECPSVNGSVPFDHDISNMLAGLMCESAPAIEFVAAGRTKSDTMNPRSPQVDAILVRTNRILSLFTGRSEGRVKIYPAIKLTKQEIWDLLPETLRILAWSCRTPTYKKGVPVKCGTCVSCKNGLSK